MSYSSVGNLRIVTTTSGQCIQKAAFDQQPWSACVTQTYLSREKTTGEKERNDNASLKLCGHLHPIFNCWFAVWKKEIKTTAAMVPLLHLALPLHVYTATQLTRDTAEPTYQVCTTPVEPYLRKGQMIPKKKQGLGGTETFWSGAATLLKGLQRVEHPCWSTEKERKAAAERSRSALTPTSCAARRTAEGAACHLRRQHGAEERALQWRLGMGRERCLRWSPACKRGSSVFLKRPNIRDSFFKTQITH